MPRCRRPAPWRRGTSPVQGDGRRGYTCAAPPPCPGSAASQPQTWLCTAPRRKNYCSPRSRFSPVQSGSRRRPRSRPNWPDGPHGAWYKAPGGQCPAASVSAPGNGASCRLRGPSRRSRRRPPPPPLGQTWRRGLRSLAACPLPGTSGSSSAPPGRGGPPRRRSCSPCRNR